ncbi:hypothetical protein Drorol1_Dr00022988 [Drosera rotundifolia]
MALVFNSIFKVPQPPMAKMAHLTAINGSLVVNSQIKPQNKRTSSLVAVSSQSMAAERLMMFKSLESWVESDVLPLLKPVEKSWQPQEFLPDASLDDDEFFEQVKELREMSRELQDEHLVVLVGAMITEDALPMYQTAVNNLNAFHDSTCVSPSPWARWSRGWTAEENRHGDLLNKYLYLCGRVDMQKIEKTIQYLLKSGVAHNFDDDTHRGVIYTSFQERATSISHGNTARLAKEAGDKKLAQICGHIAADEKRHETAYMRIAQKLFEVDPDYTMLAFADMMKKKIAMPGSLMYDGSNDNLFVQYSAIAQRLGIYTVRDYADILEYLVKKWSVDKLTVLSSEAREAQDYVCSLASKIRRLEERAQTRAKKAGIVSLSWVFDRKVQL